MIKDFRKFIAVGAAAIMTAGLVGCGASSQETTTAAGTTTEASEESILAGKYLLSRPFVMATMGEISEQNELVKTWFDYIASEEGQAVITGLGLILSQ